MMVQIYKTHNTCWKVLPKEGAFQYVFCVLEYLDHHPAGTKLHVGTDVKGWLGLSQNGSSDGSSPRVPPVGSPLAPHRWFES